MKLYFVSSNPSKIKEVAQILQAKKIEVEAVDYKISEIQSQNINDIVVHKVTEAFKYVKRPLIVEHTGMIIESFGDLPGGLTQLFWDSLGSDKFGEYFHKLGTGKAKVITKIGYCDGRKIKTFEGMIEGRIVNPPRGDRRFQWDCVFQPIGYNQTFGEMKVELKNSISMRKKALDNFMSYLDGEEV